MKYPRWSTIVFMFMMAMLVIGGINFFQTRNNIHAERLACLAGSARSAQVVNALRIIYIADTKAARVNIPGAGIRGLEAEQLNSAILGIDRHIDPVVAHKLKYPLDRAAVLVGSFSCEREYPEPSVLP